MASSDRALDLVGVVADLRDRLGRLEALAAGRLGVDLRPGAPWGRIASVEATAAGQTGITAATDLTGLTNTFTAPGGRAYWILGMVVTQQVTSAGIQNLLLRDGSNTQLAAPGGTIASGSFTTWVVSKVVTPSAGSVTYKLSATTSAGTLSVIQSATAPSTLTIVDIGPE